MRAEPIVPPATARLYFRTWRVDDHDLAEGLWGDERVVALIGGPFSREQVRQRLDGEIKQERDHGIQYWPVFLTEGDVHVGCCGLRPYEAEHRIFELGFHLRADFWGKGLATEAAHSVITHAFGNLGAKGLFAGHNPNNRMSRRTLEKLCFRYVRDEFYAPTGLNHPSYLLTREEYTNGERAF